MLLRLFKGDTPGVLFLISVTYLGVWISILMHPPAVSLLHEVTDPMPLYGLLEIIAGKNYLAGVILSFSIAAAIAFMIVHFNTTSFFINERTYLPAMIYILSISLFPEYLSLNPVIPGAFFLLLAVIRILETYRLPGIAYNFFDAGLLISTGSLFYANLLWFGVLIIAGIILLRTGDVAEIAISLAGLLTPYLLTMGVYYVMSKDPLSLLAVLADNLFSRTEGYVFMRLTTVALIFGGFMILISLAYLLSHLNNKKIKSRKIFSLLISMFLLSVAVYFILPSVSVEMIWIAGIPVSYFTTHYLVFNKKKLLPEILLSVFIILIIIVQILHWR